MPSITSPILPLVAPVLRRPQRPHSGRSGLLDSIAFDRAVSRQLNDLIAPPVASRAEFRRTGITREVEDLFREVQRMPRGRR